MFYASNLEMDSIPAETDCGRPRRTFASFGRNSRELPCRWNGLRLGLAPGQQCYFGSVPRLGVGEIFFEMAAVVFGVRGPPAELFDSAHAGTAAFLSSRIGPVRDPRVGFRDGGRSDGHPFRRTPERQHQANSPIRTRARSSSKTFARRKGIATDASQSHSNLQQSANPFVTMYKIDGCNRNKITDTYMVHI